MCINSYSLLREPCKSVEILFIESVTNINFKEVVIGGKKKEVKNCINPSHPSPYKD